MKQTRIRLIAVLLLSASIVPSAGASSLGKEVRKAVATSGFESLVDGKVARQTAPWYPRIAHVPQIDVAVIELDSANRVRDSTNVLFSRDYPSGVVVGSASRLSSADVRYRKWDQNRWDEHAKRWSDPFSDGEDVVRGRERAPIEYMAAYPASLFKLAVGFWTMRLVDERKITLADTIEYPSGSGIRKSIGELLDGMITQSHNTSTLALLTSLHRLHEVERLNDWLARVGLESITVKNTNPDDGRGWMANRGIHMGALDTAKLLWLIDGGPGTLWRGEAGFRVEASELSQPSRLHLKQLLAQQGVNEVLSPWNWCGAELGPPIFPATPRPLFAEGIPSLTTARFVDPRTGYVTINDGDSPEDAQNYGHDIGPCNQRAEVTFAHKTGLVSNGGSDAGIVHSIPGKPERHYVIAVITNIGARFADPIMNTALTPQHLREYDWTAKGIHYPEVFGRLGGRIDRLMKQRAGLRGVRAS